MMLETLRRVVQEVGKAPDLDHALEIIVGRVKSVLDVEVCSVYLVDEERGEYVLRATDGLARASVGRVKLPFGQGLVGLIARRAETINLAEGRSHPGFHLVRETGEEPFHGFLGAPIIRHRKVLGVLVAQRERTGVQRRGGQLPGDLGGPVGGGDYPCGYHGGLQPGRTGAGSASCVQ